MDPDCPNPQSTVGRHYNSGNQYQLAGLPVDVEPVPKKSITMVLNFENSNTYPSPFCFCLKVKQLLVLSGLGFCQIKQICITLRLVEASIQNQNIPHTNKQNNNEQHLFPWFPSWTMFYPPQKNPRPLPPPPPPPTKKKKHTQSPPKKKPSPGSFPRSPVHSPTRPPKRARALSASSLQGAPEGRAAETREASQVWEPSSKAYTEPMVKMQAPKDTRLMVRTPDVTGGDAWSRPHARWRRKRWVGRDRRCMFHGREMVRTPETSRLELRSRRRHER